MGRNIPSLISLASFFAQRWIFRKRPPLLASFKLTYQCNLKCLACPFHHRPESPGRQMTWSLAIDTLQKLKQMGTRIVVFEGGEPFLWHDGSFDIRDIVRYARRHFLRVAVTTNGTFPLDVPSDVLWVSLDGLKETQDRLRSGSFDQV